jgi:O-antigen ligase
VTISERIFSLADNGNPESAASRLRVDYLSPLGLPLRAALQGVAVLILFTSGFVDLPRAVRLGPVTGQAVLTVIYFLLGILFLALTPSKGVRARFTLLPLFCFLVWAVASLAWTPVPESGAQNILVIGAMLVLLLVAEAASSSDPQFAFWLEKQFSRGVLLAVLPYAAAAIWFGAGTDDLFSARCFGLFALFGVAQQLARWRYGARSGLVWATAITVLIGVSQSRLALGIAVLLFPVAQLPTRRAVRALKMLAVLLVALAASASAFFYFDSLRNRFLSGDVSLRLGSIAINGSGRTAFWRATLGSWQESLIVGKGAGSAEGLIDSNWSGIEHPHCDYLRIGHDYGLVGLTAWLVGVGALLVALRRSWLRAERLGKGLARVQLTAFLALISYALQMTMENALVYIFLGAPLGLLVGCALGLDRRGTPAA